MKDFNLKSHHVSCLYYLYKEKSLTPTDLIELCDEDNKIIEEKINFVYKNIDSLNFEAVEQCEKTCNFCRYKQLCKLNLF